MQGAELPNNSSVKSDRSPSMLDVGGPGVWRGVRRRAWTFSPLGSPGWNRSSSVDWIVGAQSIVVLIATGAVWPV